MTAIDITASKMPLLNGKSNPSAEKTSNYEFLSLQIFIKF